ncbi:hypothetical protein KAX35_05030, partial [candidate division WOR-3 bacterium]|nr:hypothetical protein [candidate division WOR-3 bacterium]
MRLPHSLRSFAMTDTYFRYCESRMRLPHSRWSTAMTKALDEISFLLYPRYSGISTTLQQGNACPTLVGHL